MNIFELFLKNEVLPQEWKKNEKWRMKNILFFTFHLFLTRRITFCLSIIHSNAELAEFKYWIDTLYCTLTWYIIKFDTLSNLTLSNLTFSEIASYKKILSLLFDSFSYTKSISSLFTAKQDIVYNILQYEI